jgi:hypothetical protein
LNYHQGAYDRQTKEVTGVVNAQTILAAVPIDASRFHAPPTWALLAIAALVGANLVRRFGGKLNVAQGTLATVFDLALDFFELGLIVAFVNAMATTPLIASIQSLFMNAENGVASGAAGHGFHFSIDVAAVLICLLLGFLYTRTESLLFGFLFGISVLILSGFSPFVSQVVSWFSNDVASWVWNTFLAVLNWPFQHIHFTS